MPPSVNKTCFVISPIGEENSQTRKQADDLLNYIIAPAVKEKGYTVVRADQITRPGMISTDIFNLLVESELVVADITDHNPNVFYELAVRHATHKPVIQLALSGQKLPFDIANSRTIFYKYQDWESMQKCREMIAAQIDAIERDPNEFDNPLTMSLTVQTVRESENPLEQSISEILSTLKSMRGDIENLQRTTKNPSEAERMGFVENRSNPTSYSLRLERTNLINDNALRQARIDELTRSEKSEIHSKEYTEDVMKEIGALYRDIEANLARIYDINNLLGIESEDSESKNLSKELRPPRPRLGVSAKG